MLSLMISARLQDDRHLLFALLERMYPPGTSTFNPGRASPWVPGSR